MVVFAPPLQKISIKSKILCKPFCLQGCLKTHPSRKKVFEEPVKQMGVPATCGKSMGTCN